MFAAKMKAVGLGMATLVAVWQPLAPGAFRPARADMLAPAAEREATFVIGRISADLRRSLPRLDLMADYMAAKLGQVGYRKGHGVVVGRLEDMARLLQDGEIDMVSESPLSAVRLADMTGAEIVLREWKDKVPVYRSVVIVAKNSPVQKIADLRGRRIALEDRGSTTGYLLPLAALKAAGLRLVELARPEDAVPPDAVGYIFTQNELNIATWTARGLVDAGAFSDLDLEDSDRTPKRMRGDLRVIYLSEPVIRSVALLRRGLPPERREAALAALKDIAADNAAATVRHEYYRLRRYDDLDAEALRSLDTVRKALAALGPQSAPRAASQAAPSALK
ncbi:MAG TPA: phosphate/phosphite/phosphonate ABC transporter substrate-binding protein [Alphaproteobacteria bacterium]|nr:phosphate/phosphite/phosphonate ABC transporter substrate-binding protein [Alphaproteobacteria bacterium]